MSGRSSSLTGRLWRFAIAKRDRAVGLDGGMRQASLGDWPDAALARGLLMVGRLAPGERFEPVWSAAELVEIRRGR